VWLDALCLAGRLAWGRMSPPAPKPAKNGDSGTGRRSGPIRSTPMTLLSRESIVTWQSFATPPDPGEMGLTGEGLAVLEELGSRGASFFHELAAATGLLDSQLEIAFGELVARGLVTADSFTGMRALLVPSSKRPLKRGGRRKGLVAIFGVENAGRWSLLWLDSGRAAEQAHSGPVDVGGRSHPGAHPEMATGVATSLLGRGRGHRSDLAAPLRHHFPAPAGARGQVAALA